MRPQQLRCGAQNGIQPGNQQELRHRGMLQFCQQSRQNRE
jgi:hypothetical protein